MVDVNAVNNAVANGGEGTRKTGDSLGKDEFLKLLIVQMQNQDPLEPQSDTEFIAQLAQFSTLEQMQNMNNTMLLNSAIGLIGASIEWTDADGSLNIGVVTSARMYNGTAQVLVGDTAIDIDKVKVVTNDGTPLYAATAFIGSQISWLDATGNTHTGVVESVKVINNYPLLVVGKSLVDVNSIISVQSPQGEELTQEVIDAINKIGMKVFWLGADGEVQSGVVNSVKTSGGVPYLIVGDSNTVVGMDQLIDAPAESGI